MARKLKEQRDATGCSKFVNSIRVAVHSATGFELPEFTHLRIKNNIADIGDFPGFWYGLCSSQFFHICRMWFAYLFYQIAFFGFAAIFLFYQYTDARTSSFITLDNTAGVCKSDPSSTTCCEVPTVVTGEFYADSNGNWDTQPGFQFTKANYGVNLKGLQYTSDQWTEVMKGIVTDVQQLGARGQYRDFAWNLVAW